jgi:MFS family permease
MLMLAIIPAGLLCAPTITSTSEVMGRLVPERVRGEAMGWHGSALTLGGAAGAPLTGALIDGHGQAAGFAGAGLAGMAIAALGLFVQAWRRRRRVGSAATIGAAT